MTGVTISHALSFSCLIAVDENEYSEDAQNDPCNYEQRKRCKESGNSGDWPQAPDTKRQHEEPEAKKHCFQPEVRNLSRSCHLTRQSWATASGSELCFHFIFH